MLLQEILDVEQITDEMQGLELTDENVDTVRAPIIAFACWGGKHAVLGSPSCSAGSADVCAVLQWQHPG